MQIIVQPTPVSSESIQDIVAGLLQAGTNITLTYNDVANTLTIAASSSTDTEAIQDLVSAMFPDSPTIDFSYNDTSGVITANVITASITENHISLVDVASDNADTSKHGFLPKLSGNTTTFLCGDGTWVVPPAGTSYTDEQAQDAIGTILTNTPAIVFTYNDATPSISAALGFGGVASDRIADDAVTFAKMQNITDQRLLGRSTGAGPGNIGELTVGVGLTLSGGVLSASGGYSDEQAQDAVGAALTNTTTIQLVYNDAANVITANVVGGSINETHIDLSDVTTDNATSAKHGFLPKLNNNTAQYLDGTGAWSTPAGGTSYWTRTPGAAVSETALIAFWRMEEASGNRVDSKNSIALVPTGTPSNAAGKNGNALAFTTAATTYLSAPDSANLSVGANQDFSIACWIYFNGTPSGARGVIGKGNASISYNNCEYLLGTSGTNLLWYIRSANVNAGITLVATTWYFVVAWYDATADIQYIQVNNGTPAQFANSTGSFDSADPVEVGRQPQYTGSAPFDGRIDNLMFWKRVLTASERTALYNSGNGVDYPFIPPNLTTTTPGDQVLLSSSASVSTERLEVDSGIKLANSSGVVDGIIRWTGTDIEVRKGSVWTSLTTTSFLLLTDSPDVYAGNALKLLRVNAAENALEYGPVLGTMATQDASAVSITGGTGAFTGNVSAWNISFMTDAGFAVPDYAGNNKFGYWTNINVAGGTGRYAVNCAGTAPAYFGGTVFVVGQIETNTHLRVNDRTGNDQYGMLSLLNAAGGTGRYAILAQGTAPSYFGGTVQVVGRTTGNDFWVADHAGNDQVAYFSNLNAAGGTNRWFVNGSGNAPSYFGGTVQVVGLTTLSRAHIGNASGAPSNNKVLIPHSKATEDALVIIPTDSDTGPGNAILFRNGAGAVVGAIYTSGSGTTYGTTSDVRLKHSTKPLTKVLDCIRALRPISYLWNADDSYGEGFLAHELMQEIPLAVTGEPDEINEDGSIRPQQVDHSKLVPRLTAGLQEALGVIESLTARVASLEAQLAARFL